MSDAFTPTPEQYPILSHAGNAVITACPGGGKTAVLAELIRRQLVNLKSHEGVIAITFTKKASRELRERCKRDATNTKFSFFGTIDGFCLGEIIYPFIGRIWGEHHTELKCIRLSEFSSELHPQKPVIENAFFKREEIYKHENYLTHCYESGFILLESIAALAGFVLERSAACQRYIKAKYKSVYIDEYQDSSESQHWLFLRLTEIGLRSIAVGDVNQSIYEFRGSCPAHIRQLIEMSDVFKHFQIGLNHRCHQSIVNYASRVIDPTCNIIPEEDLRVIRCRVQGDQSDVARSIGDLIPEVIDYFKISKRSNIALLVRNNSGLDFVSNGINIPCRIYLDDPLRNLSSDGARLLVDLLQYRFDPSLTAEDVIAANRTVKLNVSQVKIIRKIISSVRSINLIEFEKQASGIAKTLLGSDVTKEEGEALSQVLQSDSLLLQFYPVNEGEVQVMTLHKSKGLEFDVVFHLDLLDWVFPHREFTGDFNEEKYPNWDQDLNLHYVGITRARKACYLFHSTRRVNGAGENRAGSPSKFLSIPGLNGLYIGN